jgi:hypothetical protein
MKQDQSGRSEAWWLVNATVEEKEQNDVSEE